MLGFFEEDVDRCQVMFLFPMLYLCQCTSFDVEAFDLYFLFQNFVNSLNIIAKSFQMATSQSLENIALIHGSLNKLQSSAV